MRKAIFTLLLVATGCNLFGEATPVGDQDTGAMDMTTSNDVAVEPDAGMDQADLGVALDTSSPDTGTLPDTGTSDMGGCLPESDPDFCARLNAQCGELTAANQCGDVQTVDCGGCTAPATCGGGGTPNRCGCAAQSDQEFCAAMGAACGEVTGLDACGQMRTTTCGGCTAPENCGGEGVANQCGCTPESDMAFCSAAGVQCDMHSGTDSCGMARTANCGACMAGTMCSAGQCVSDGSCNNGICDAGEDISCPQDCVGVVAISAGDSFTCARRSDDSLWCWGSNSKGQYGNGTTDPSLVAAASTTAGLLADLAAGAKTACVVEQGGQLRCAGDDKNGMLARSIGGNSESPVFVDAVGVADGRAVDLSRSHGCVTTTTNQVLCWGLNKSGALGDNTTNDAAAPVTVLGGIAFQRVSAGDDFTCGVTDNFLAYCWGENGAGQLGDGTMTDRLSPVQVTGLTNVVDVSAGGGNACALLDDGNVRCWGDGLLGQLGNGMNTVSSTPVQVSGLTSADAIDCGPSHCCAVMGGGVQCWGGSDFGQTGQVAVSVTTPVSVPVNSAAGVSAGASHSCAWTTTGEAYCWGSNLAGQLGNNSIVDSTAPVAVQFP